MASAELTVTLPSEIADLIDVKVRSGFYASASEVIQDGLRALEERELSLETWLREEVIPGHAEYEANPTGAVPADALLARIEARRLQGGA